MGQKLSSAETLTILGGKAMSSSSTADLRAKFTEK